MSSQNPGFIPGPINIPERLRHAANAPAIDHCSASFGEKFRPLFSSVKDILETKTGEVVIFAVTGSAGWEAAISNTVSPDDKILACSNATTAQKYRDTDSALSEAA